MKEQVLSAKYALPHGDGGLVLGSEQLDDHGQTLSSGSDVSLLPFHS